jgi:hypothetical protein
MDTVYEAADHVEGHIIIGLLQSRDIPCWLNGHYLQGAVGEIPVMGLTTIQVENAWTNQAMKLISAYQSGELSVSDDGE